MAYNLGIRLGVDGEKEFKDALKGINQDFKLLGSEMKLATSHFDKNEKSVQSLTAQNEVFNKQIVSQKDKIGMLEKALENANDTYGENDKRTKQWAIELNNARADLNKMEKSVKDNEKAIDEMGKETAQAEKPTKELGEEVKKTGDKSDDAKSKFGGLGKAVGSTAKAMGTAMLAIGTAAVAAGAAMAKLTVDAAVYADDIMTMATVTGLSTEALQSYTYAAELLDVSVETITKSMAKQVKSMDSARNGSKYVQAAYDKLGVSITGSNGELRDSETVYWEAIDALGKMKNETERDAIAMQLFGKSARDLNPLIQAGAAGVAEMTAEAKAMGAVLSDDTLNSLGEFDDALQRLKQGTAAAQRNIGTMLLPQLKELAGDGADLLAQFSGGLAAAGGDFNKISQVIGETLGGVVAAIMKNLPKILKLGLDIILSLVKGIVDNLPTVIKSATKIIVSLVQGLLTMLPQITKAALQLVLELATALLDNLPMIIQAAMTLVIELARGIAEALPTLIPSVIQAVLLVVQTLIDNIPMLIDAALMLIQGLADGLIAALPMLMEAVPEIILSIVQVLDENLGEIVMTAVQIILALINGLVDALPQLLDAVPMIIDAIVDVLVNNIDMVVEAAIQLMMGIVKAIPKVIVSVVKALPDIISSIVGGLARGWTAIFNVGRNLIEGLWNGIKSMVSWINDKLKSFGEGVLKGIKKFFGIESPSKLFRDVIGKNLALGIGEGFVGQMKSVTQSMARAMPTAFDAIPITTSLRGLAGQTAFAGAAVGGGVVNIYPQQMTQAQTDYIINKIDREWGRKL